MSARTAVSLSGSSPVSFLPGECIAVLRKIRQELLDALYAVLLTLHAEICDAGYLAMDLGATQLFKGDVLMHD